MIEFVWGEHEAVIYAGTIAAWMSREWKSIYEFAMPPSYPNLVQNANHIIWNFQRKKSQKRKSNEETLPILRQGQLRAAVRCFRVQTPHGHFFDHFLSSVITFACVFLQQKNQYFLVIDELLRLVLGPVFAFRLSLLCCDVVYIVFTKCFGHTTDKHTHARIPFARATFLFCFLGSWAHIVLSSPFATAQFQLFVSLVVEFKCFVFLSRFFQCRRRRSLNDGTKGIASMDVFVRTYE